MHHFLYLCDVAKNTACKKTGCHINGGDCYRTANIAFAIQPIEKVLLVIPNAGLVSEEEDTDKEV